MRALSSVGAAYEGGPYVRLVQLNVQRVRSAGRVWPEEESPALSGAW